MVLSPTTRSPRRRVRRRRRARSRARAKAAAVQVPLRRARVEPVRGHLPPAVVPHHPSGDAAARAARPGRRGGTRSRPRARSSSLAAAAARSSCCWPRRSQRRGASARVHLIDISSQALEQTRAAAEPPASRLGRRAPVDLRGRAAHGTSSARADGSTMLVLLLGSNIGNFDQPAAARVPRSHPRRARARRSAAARRRPRQAGSAICCSPTTIRSASPPRSTRTCWSASTASSAETSTSTAFAHRRGVESRRSSRVEMHLVSRADQDVRIPAAPD